MKKLISVALLATPFGLSACGGTSTTTPSVVEITASEAALQLFATDGADDLGRATNDGETISARSIATASILRTYDAQTTEPTDAKVQVLRNSTGHLSLIVDGVRIDFTEADQQVESDGKIYGYEREGSNQYINVFNYAGEITDILEPGNGYAKPLGFYIEKEENSPDAITGFAIVGIETPESGLPMSGTASFSGKAEMNLLAAENFNNFSQRNRLRGDIMMNLNIADGTISGEWGNLSYQVGRDGPIDAVSGAILMQEATYNENGYSGNLRLDAAAQADFELDSAGVGQYSGTFYGPEANTTAGVLTGSVDAEGGRLNGYGYFIGYKD